jgi:hypothetical protein
MYKTFHPPPPPPLPPMSDADEEGIHAQVWQISGQIPAWDLTRPDLEELHLIRVGATQNSRS